MVSKIRVYGRAMNRTALGIFNAYQVMYPHATFEDFVKAFPIELNDETAAKAMFKKWADVTPDKNPDAVSFFLKDDELMTLPDGTKMACCCMWTGPTYKKLTDHAEQYGIVVAEFERTMKGEKGGYRLEYLNGYVPPVPEKTEKKKIPAWVWIAVAVAVLAALAAVFFLGRSGKNTEVVEVEKQVVVHDTVYTEKLEELETKFNDAQFEQGKAELNDDAKFVLHDLAKLLEKNPTVKLKIEGHTSAEGDAATNQKLSEDRAKVTVDFLVSQGVDQSRLSYQGYGSSKLKNTQNPNAEENRRTEFTVIE